MTFPLRNFLSFSVSWLTSPGWNPRRLVVTIAFYIVFPLLEMTVWSGLLLDRIFFKGYRREVVSSPLFIIGNPRSGTTFLHRLIARDVERFTTMRMWEILFAPSVVQRKVLHAVAAVLRRRERSSGKLARLEENWYNRYGMHPISFTKPEEDEYLLLHIWSSLAVGLSAGLLEQALPYTFFDAAVPAVERKHILIFYKACIQRHLHARRLRTKGEPGFYLAKNPALCPKVKSIKEVFPDAKFIYVARNPLEMMPSYVSMMKLSWRAVGAGNHDAALRAYIAGMARHWYRYPPEQLDLSGTEHVIVHYEDLVRDPERTVRRIYRRLGFDIGPAFAAALRKECAGMRIYRSRHVYDFTATGLDPQRLRAQFEDVFNMFGFKTGGSKSCGH